jgi:hypothetical protein
MFPWMQRHHSIVSGNLRCAFLLDGRRHLAAATLVLHGKATALLPIV